MIGCEKTGSLQHAKSSPSIWCQVSLHARCSLSTWQWRQRCQYATRPVLKPALLSICKNEPREHTMQHKMQHTVHCILIGFSMSFSDLPHVVERGHILFRRIMLIRMRVMQATSTLWLYSAMRNGKCIFVNAFQSCKGCLDTTTNHKRSVHSANWGRVMKSLWFSAVHHGAQLRAGIRSPRALGLFFNWSLFDFNSSLLPIDQCRQKDKDLSNGRRQWG